jgi:DNA polymerase delta subunit 2
MENASGDFEIIDLCFAGLPPLASTSTSTTKSRSGVIPLQTGGKGNMGVGAGKVKGKGKQVDVDVDVDMDMKVDDDMGTRIKPSLITNPAGESPSSSLDGRWVALVSGLSAGSSEVPEDLKGQLLVEWLMGELGDVEVSPERERGSRHRLD